MQDHEQTCEWKEDYVDVWDTTCGNKFQFIDSGPEENGMSFCCYCGKQLIPIKTEDE